MILLSLMKFIELKVDLQYIRGKVEVLIPDIEDKEYARSVLKRRLEEILKEINKTLEKTNK